MRAFATSNSIHIIRFEVQRDTVNLHAIVSALSTTISLPVLLAELRPGTDNVM